MKNKKVSESTQFWGAGAQVADTLQAFQKIQSCLILKKHQFSSDFQNIF